jgi:hypothetical protein
MVYVSVFGVLVGLAGLVVVALRVRTVWRQVKSLGATVAAASDRVAAASAELETIAPRER